MVSTSRVVACGPPSWAASGRCLWWTRHVTASLPDWLSKRAASLGAGRPQPERTTTARTPAVAAPPLGPGMVERPRGIAVVRSELGGHEVVDDAVGIEQALLGCDEAVLLLRRVLASQGGFEVAQLEDVLRLGNPVHDRPVIT